MKKNKKTNKKSLKNLSKVIERKRTCVSGKQAQNKIWWSDITNKFYKTKKVAKLSATQLPFQNMRSN